MFSGQRLHPIQEENSHFPTKPLTVKCPGPAPHPAQVQQGHATTQPRVHTAGSSHMASGHVSCVPIPGTHRLLGTSCHKGHAVTTALRIHLTADVHLELLVPRSRRPWHAVQYCSTEDPHGVPRCQCCAVVVWLRPTPVLQSAAEGLSTDSVAAERQCCWRSSHITTACQKIWVCSLNLEV